MDRMLAGVSTRRFAGVGEPVGEEVEQASSLHVEDVGVGHVRRAHPHRARRADEPPPGRRAAGGDDARRDRDRRAHARGRARDHDRRRQDPARAVGGLDRERDARPHAARRPGRPRPRPRAGDPVRDRRRQGAQAGDQGRLRRARARSPLPPPQGEKRHRSVARARPRRGPRADARGLVADRPASSPSSGSSCSPAELDADLARRRRLAARRHATTR